MSYTQLIPAATQSGGRKNNTARAWLASSGLLMVSDALVSLLGEPSKVIVESDVPNARLRLTPALPDDAGAFTLSGSGGSRRIYLKAFASANPTMVGEFSVKRQAHSVILERDICATSE